MLAYKSGLLTAEETKDNLIRLFEKLHSRLPNAVVHFILINHVPGYYSVKGGNFATYWDYSTDIDIANNAVIEYAATHDYLKIIDAGTCLQKENGSYSKAYFRNDGLHMSVAGYALWGAEVKKAVIAVDKERYEK